MKRLILPGLALWIAAGLALSQDPAKPEPTAPEAAPAPELPAHGGTGPPTSVPPPARQPGPNKPEEAPLFPSTLLVPDGVFTPAPNLEEFARAPKSDRGYGPETAAKRPGAPQAGRPPRNWIDQTPAEAAAKVVADLEPLLAK